MPILYTMPGTCSLAPNIAVAWLGAPVEIHNMAYGDHKKDAYLAVNPKGKVPALRFDDGDVLTEAAAILTFLGAEYGGEGSQGYSRDRRLGRKEAEALSYMTSEVHASFGPHFAVGGTSRRLAEGRQSKNRGRAVSASVHRCVRGRRDPARLPTRIFGKRLCLAHSRPGARHDRPAVPTWILRGA